MEYMKICKVIELYNKYKGNLNDDGTVATDEQIAEWIVPSVEDCKEEINDEELDNTAIDKAVIYSDTYEERTGNYGMHKESLAYGYRDGYYDGYMEGSRKAQEL